MYKTDKTLCDRAMQRNRKTSNIVYKHLTGIFTAKTERIAGK